MGFYVRNFYIEKRDVYTLLALGVLGYARYKRYPLPYVNYDAIIILAVLFLLSKGLLLPAHDSIIFIVFFAALLLTLFSVPFLQIILFVFLSFLFLRLFKVI